MNRFTGRLNGNFAEHAFVRTPFDQIGTKSVTSIPAGSWTRREGQWNTPKESSSIKVSPYFQV